MQQICRERSVGALMKIVGVLFMLFALLAAIGGIANLATVDTVNSIYSAGYAIGTIIGALFFIGPLFGLGLILFNLPGYIRKQAEKSHLTRAFD
jgi:uncharacterized membrane protein YciS (DUF1049 family)